MYQWNKTEFRNRTTHLQSIDFQQWCQGSSMGKKIEFSTNDCGTTGYPIGKKRNKTYVLTSHHT